MISVIVAILVLVGVATSRRASTSSTFQSKGSDYLVAILAWAFLIPAGFALVGILLGHGAWQSVTIGLALLAVVITGAFPWAVARFVCIPLALPRAAAFVTRRSLVVWAGDRAGASVVAAILAAERMRTTNEAARERAWSFVEESLQKSKDARGALLLAEAMLAARRGARDDVAQLLRAITLLPSEITPNKARAIAGLFVVEEALASGDLQRAAQVSPVASFRLRLLVACARALTLSPRDHGATLGARVSRALSIPLLRARLAILPLVVLPRAPLLRLVEDAKAALRASRARSAPPRATPAPSGTRRFAPPPPMSPEAACMIWLARAAQDARSFSCDDVAALGEALDDAASRLALVVEGDDALGDASFTALFALARRAISSFTREQLATHASTTLHSLLDEGSDDDLRPLALVCEEIEELDADEPSVAELARFVRFRLALDDAEARGHAEAAYSVMRDAAWNHGSAIFNRGHHGIGRAYFHLVAARARRCGDHEAQKGMRENLRV